MSIIRDEVKYFLELLWIMTEKELKARYKRTLLGILWLVANPFLQMIVIGFIFTFIIKKPIKNYYFYLFIGLLVWNFFSTSLIRATSSIVYERSLIKKSVFPKSVIPLSVILSNFVHFVLALIIFSIPVLFIDTFYLAKIPYFFYAMVFLFILTIGLSLIISALNVRYRDVNFLVQAILLIWFYATPIIYTFSFIPHKLIWMWRFNPMTSIVQSFQTVFADAASPSLTMMLINSLVILTTMFIGIRVFQKKSRYFDDWL